MNDETRQEIALKRFALISPVINGFEPNASQYFRQVCEEAIAMPHYGERLYSPKTLRYWLNLYTQHGFDALRPGFRSDRGKSRKMTPVLEAAIAEKLAAFPRMKGSVLYDQLAEEQRLAPSEISRATFYRYLANQPDLRLAKATAKTQRFAYRHVNEFWQADIMFGPKLRDGRRRRETYLICFLDDASRLIPYSMFAFEQDFLALRHVLKEAVARRGKPKILYTDNGKIYRAKQLALICAAFGCTVAHAKPYHAAAKGKQERFFQTVRTRFLSTIDPDTMTLDQLNMHYQKWLDHDYHRKHHSTLGKSPLEFFMEQADRVAFVQDPPQLDALFLLRIQRKVRSNATLQLENVLYETDYSLVGSTVEVRYEPEWIGTPHQPLLLFQQDVQVGEAHLVDVYDNAQRRRPSGRRRQEKAEAEAADSAVRASKLSYARATKGDV